LQNLQLLLYLPDLPAFEPQSAVSWQLFDRQANLLRDGSGPLTSGGSVPRAEHTVIVIPARRVVYIETALPPVSTSKRDALLRYAIEDKLTIDPATVHAVVIGPAAGKDSTVHVIAAIDRAWLAGALRWLGSVGIAPARAVSASALIPVSAGEWGVLLDGTHGLARRADGFAYSFDVARAGGTATGMPDEPPFALALALKEARAQQMSPSQLTVFVGQPVHAPWVDTWPRVLDCRVRMDKIPAAHMPPADAGNLLSGDFAPPASGSAWMAMLKPVLALAAGIAIVQVSFTLVDAWRLDQRRRAIEGEMTQVFKDAFPNAQAIVDAPLQMQRNLDAMKRERGLAGIDDARAPLAQLTNIISAVPGLKPQRVTIRDSNVSIEASVPDRPQQLLLESRAAAARGATFAVDAGNIVRLSAKAER
jgi:general secretion pathway protein L